ncbi:MAG: hypothetical protein JNK15_22445 [Planctomycetes bacterium]|nr:hypothetical protein [Planctomycetota bacterium]
MAKPKPKRGRRWLRILGITLGSIVLFLLLFVVAFLFNPFEGSLPEVRDAVPRGVNFFARKARLADDFDPFPTPKFWGEVAEARGFTELAQGSIGQSWKRAGIDRMLVQATEQIDKVKADSGGFLDLMRDVLGQELVVAGYELDYSQSPARPLAEPWWCIYTRVTWRVKAALGAAGFGLVQSQLKDGGLDVSSDGADLVVRMPGAQQPIRLRRRLDLLMISNHAPLLDQSTRLLDGAEDEEPIGKMAAYTDGAQKRIDRWADKNDQDPVNVLEFVVEPNAFDGFRRFAAGWPNAQNKDSMNERVLATFLNLRGWQQVAGGVMFADGVMAATGRVNLNSKQHSPFQSSFYKAEEQRREEWLDPFLAMVPESACAAAALRVPAGDFLHAMIDSLEDAERELFNDALRRVTFNGQNLNDLRDLVDRVRTAFLPRTGFVFRQNDPDTTRDPQTGELQVPVTARSPVPQVAWVFWLKPNGDALAKELVKMLSTFYSTFRFKKVWELPVQFPNGRLSEAVTEFTNPQIPGTGEIAVIVFRDFLVLSNSGPLVRDIIKTKYTDQTGARSIRNPNDEAAAAAFAAIERELPSELNGFVWVHGDNLVPMFDDYLAAADANNELPDPEWMASARQAAEDQVRRSQFPTYGSIAAIPETQRGQFEQAVGAYLREQWRKERSNVPPEARAQILQMRAMAQMLKVGCLQLELENSFAHFQARLVLNRR